MAGRPWKLLETISSKILKSNSSLTNALERNLSEIQNIASKKYETIVKSVNGTTIIQDLNNIKLNELDNKQLTIPKQLVNWWKWYQHLTGLDDVELARQQMIFIQDKLFNCQDRRRDLNHEMTLISEKLQDVYGELIQTKRDDQKYVQLTIIENKSLQEQKRIMTQLNLLESEERDYFTQLSTAIKEYHDSQNMNAQKYKYLSILASASIAILSLVGSTIYNNKRIADVHKIIAEGQNKNEMLFKTHFQTLQQIILNNENNNSSSINENIIIPDEPMSKVIKEDNFFSDTKNIFLGTIIILFIWNKLFS